MKNNLRGLFLTAAILALLAAVGAVLDRVLSWLLTYIVSDGLSTVMTLYGRMSAAVGGVWGLALGFVILVAAARTTGKRRLGLAFFATGVLIAALTELFAPFLGSATLQYPTMLLGSGLTALLTLTGGIVLCLDPTLGTTRIFAVAMGVSQCILSTLAAVSAFAGLMLVVSSLDSWLSLVVVMGQAGMFTSIVAWVVTSTMFLLFWAEKE